LRNDELKKVTDKLAEQIEKAEALEIKVIQSVSESELSEATADWWQSVA